MAAKKIEEEQVSLIDTFREFKETKNIDRTTLVSVLEESFRNVLAKIFGSDENFDVIVNPDKGDFEIYRNRMVVANGEVEDENKEIALKDAQKIQPDYEVGEELSEPVNFAKFGRRAILNLRQTLASKILELEHDSLYNKYKDRVGQIVAGEVYQVWKREVLVVDDENNELILPKSEQINGEYYSVGSRIKVLIKEIERNERGAQLILSRGCAEFIEYLFRQEVPEIETGSVEIKAVAREAGVRTKIAVAASMPGIDPVGTFVGGRGVRVQAVMNEIGDREKIDIINWSDNASEYIREALSPAEIQTVEIKDGHATVYVAKDQQSIAIGRGGQNVRLASKLTGFEIDVEVAKAPEKKKKKNVEDSLLSALEESEDEEAEEGEE